jgi:uncharacterized protein YjbK
LKKNYLVRTMVEIEVNADSEERAKNEVQGLFEEYHFPDNPEMYKIIECIEIDMS